MQEKFNSLYIYDDGLLISRATGRPLCNMDRDGYIRVRVGGKEYRAHRVIWEMFNGPIPEGILIDHKDGDVYNNRIENLRAVTRQQNNMNSRKKGNRDLPKGVSRSRNKYRAKIYYNGEEHCLGTFDTIENAQAAYYEAASILHGEYIHTPEKFYTWPPTAPML